MIIRKLYVHNTRSKLIGGGGVDTNWDEHHEGGVVGRCGLISLSENGLRWWVFLNNLCFGGQKMD